MWRKKVDNSLFRYGGTTIPKWIASRWKLEKHFPDVKGQSSKNNKNTETTVSFSNKNYKGNLTCLFPKKRASKVHRLWLSEELIDELKKVFVMSHMTRARKKSLNSHYYLNGHRKPLIWEMRTIKATVRLIILVSL